MTNWPKNERCARRTSPEPGTGRTGVRLRARLGASAVAAIARIEHLEVDLLLDARRHFGERERNVDLHIGAGLRTTARSATAAEHFLEAAKPADVAHENAERLGEVDVMEARRRRRASPASP